MKTKTQRIKICVTREHIRHGARAMCDVCPIAIAMNRSLRNAKTGLHALVSKRRAHLYDEDSNPLTMVDFPVSVTDFIDLFDGHHQVYPFDFKIDFDIKNGTVL